MPVAILVALFGYVLGSIPTGLLLTKLFSKEDPRQGGSKNIGATNVYRTAGKKFGILTLVGDLLKGAIPIAIAFASGLPDLWGIPSGFWIALIGLSPFIGHLFPIFLRFKGGKGVATALGVYLILSPLAVLVELLIFLGVVWKWRFISLGSILCSLTMPVLIAVFTADSFPYVVMAIIIAALIIYRHHSNISRLLAGNENRWKT